MKLNHPIQFPPRRHLGSIIQLTACAGGGLICATSGSMRSPQINADITVEELGAAIEGPPRTPRVSQNLNSSPLSPRNSRTSQAMAKASPVVSPRASRVSQSMLARASPVSTPRASRTSLAIAETAPAPGSRYSSRTSQILETFPPTSGNSRTRRSIAEAGHTCLTPSLSVTSLVQPVQDEEVGTVEEDLVSSGAESVNTEELWSSCPPSSPKSVMIIIIARQKVGHNLDAIS